MRLYEASGIETRARVEARLLGSGACLDFKPQEIRTLRVGPDGEWNESAITEYDL
jgi:hypothetical protein